MRLGPFPHDGVTLAVHAVGNGRPMLWQHGLCGDAGQTAEVFPEGIGWQGLTVECRGHGASEAGPLDALGFGTFAQDLGAFVETLGGPVVVGGISMGAALALRLAVERPDLLSGLVLARPAWLWEMAPANMAPYALVGELLARHGPEEARAAFEASDTARRLAEGNAAYEARFDRVFLIRAAGRDAEQRLAELDRRLANDDDAERAETVDNLRQIALLRLEAAL